MYKSFYEENTANYPRLKTDSFFADYDNTYKYNGFIDKAFNFIEDFQLLKPELWRITSFSAQPTTSESWLHRW